MAFFVDEKIAVRSGKVCSDFCRVIAKCQSRHREFANIVCRQCFIVKRIDTESVVPTHQRCGVPLHKLGATHSFCLQTAKFSASTIAVLQTKCERFHARTSLWSEWRDLNSRPHGPEPCALPNCATPR